jgi:hypothetical protein
MAEMLKTSGEKDRDNTYFTQELIEFLRMTHLDYKIISNPILDFYL